MSELDHSVQDAPDLAATGDRRVDAALARLERLAELPVTAHAGEFETISAVLREALDDGPAEVQP
jgi:hypothetical protein